MMHFTRTCVFDGVTREMVLDCSEAEFKEGWVQWQAEGRVIQDAFPFLSADEREFILTGMTPDMWDRMVGEE